MHSGSIVSKNPTSQSRIFGLDLLRAIAILSVVVMHCLQGWLQPPYEFLLYMALYGVELFFVLSGFLIGGILLRAIAARKFNDGSDLWHFWKRRWLRTLPNYYLFLLLNLAAVYFLGFKSDFNWRYFIFLQNLAYPHPSFFGEAWSLAVEEWFYLTVPLALFAAVNYVPAITKDRAKIVWVLLLLLAAFTVLRFVYVKTYNPGFDSGVRKVVVLRMDALLFGVLAAYFAHYHSALWRKWRLLSAALGVLIIVVTCVAINKARSPDASINFRTHYFTLTSLGCALLLPAASCWRECGGWLARSIQHVSLISYSLYLFHYSFWLGAILPLLKNKTGPGGFLIFFSIYFVGSMLAASLVYCYFERPLMNLRKPDIPHPAE